MVLEDGVSHAVDSSELAFRLAAIGAMRQCELRELGRGSWGEAAWEGLLYWVVRQEFKGRSNYMDLHTHINTLVVPKATPIILEPIMSVEVVAPSEFQVGITSSLL